MKKGRVAAVIISLLALAGVAAGVYYVRNYMKNPAAGMGTAMARGGRSTMGGGAVYAVRTQVVEIETLNDYVQTNGNVEALSSISVYPNIGGKIVSVSVNLGSSVKRGDIIARIDPSQPGVKYSLSPVTAPISGTVISKPLDIGTTVSTASAVAIIGDISALQVTTNVSERYVGYMQAGLKAEVSLAAYPDVVFPATVSYVSPVLDAATRTKQVVLRFTESDNRLNAGMFAKIKLYTVQHSGYVTVPTSAIVSNGNRRYMYVVKSDSTVERREITEGNAVDGVVQITSGVQSGERIVVDGGTSLFDGAKVNDISNK